MKISRIDIGAFGVWTGLRMGRLGRGLNVIAGGNEGGKSTLREFWLAMLLGFAPRRLEAVAPNKPGTAPRGQVELEVGGESYELTRRGDEVALVRKADGQRLTGGEASDRIRQWLADLDEGDLVNVFVPQGELHAGFRDLASSHLWNSVFAAELANRPTGDEVLARLASERRGLISRENPPGPLAAAWAEAERLDAEIARLRDAQATRVPAPQRDAQHEALERAERRLADLEEELRRLAVVSRAQPVWQKLAPLRRAAGDTQQPVHLPDGAVKKWNELARATQDCAEELELAEAEVEQHRTALNEHQPDATWMRLAGRIDGLAGQLAWVRTLETRHKALKDEITKLEAELVRPAQPTSTQKAPPPEWKQLARAVSRARKEARLASERAAKAEQREKQQQAVATKTVAPPPAPLDAKKLADQLPLLKRANQLNQQFHRLEAQYDEQAARCREHIAVQLIPTWVLAVLGLCLASGTVLLIGSLLRPNLIADWVGWPPAVTGLVGLLVASGAKYLWEQTAEERLAQARKQQEVTHEQLDRCYEELKQITAQLPTDPRPWAERLAEAERQQQRQRVDTPKAEPKPQPSSGSAADARRAADEAQRKLQQAKQRWQTMLREAGLPAEAQPSDLAELAATIPPVVDLAQGVQQRIDLRTQEAASLTTGIEHFRAQLDSVLAELNRPNKGDLERLVNGLLEGLEQQRGIAQQRKRVSSQGKQAARVRDEARKALRRAEQAQQRWLARCGVSNEEELLRAAEGQSTLADVAAQRPKLEEQLAKLLDGVEEQSLAEWLAKRPDQVEARRIELRHDLEVAQREVAQRQQQVEQQRASVKQLANDDALPRLLWQRAQHAARIESLERRWMALATADRALQTVLNQEQDDGPQPELLVWATEYFRRITGGRFRRIGTRWADRSLRLQDTCGTTHDIDQLTEASRQQLFLALRLALVRDQKQRGIQLPLVFDEPLIDFDDRRSQAAAKLLAELAEQGHQVIVLTCQERFVELFRAHGASLLRLPPWGEARPTLAVEPVSEPQVVAKPAALPEPEPRPAPEPEPETVPAPAMVEELPEPPIVPAASEPEPAPIEPPPEPAEPRVIPMPSVELPRVDYRDEHGDPIGPIVPARPKRVAVPLGLRPKPKRPPTPKPLNRHINGHAEPWPWPSNGRAYR